MELAANLSADQKETLYCTHLEQAQKALEVQDYADKKFVKIEDMEKLINKPDDLVILKASSSDGLIPVYVLPGNNHVVPSFSPPSYESPLQLIHIRNYKCPLGSCQEKRTKLHTLVAKKQPLCLHTLLCHSVKDSDSPNLPKRKDFVPRINRDLSINFVIEQIQCNFPSMVSLQSNELIRRSRKYVEKLTCNTSRNEIIHQHTPKVCKFCKETLLLDWPFKSKKSFLLSMGHIAQIEIPLKVCPTCKRVFYPGKYFFFFIKLILYKSVVSQVSQVSLKLNYSLIQCPQVGPVFVLTIFQKMFLC